MSASMRKEPWFAARPAGWSAFGARAPVACASRELAAVASRASVPGVGPEEGPGKALGKAPDHDSASASASSAIRPISGRRARALNNRTQTSANGFRAPIPGALFRWTLKSARIPSTTCRRQARPAYTRRQSLRRRQGCATSLRRAKSCERRSRAPSASGPRSAGRRFPRRAQNSCVKSMRDTPSSSVASATGTRKRR